MHDDPRVWKSPQGPVHENRGRVVISLSLSRALSFFFYVTFFSHPMILARMRRSRAIHAAEIGVHRRLPKNFFFHAISRVVCTEAVLPVTFS